jgi:HAD superfamily hydrolase (TIGR01484 family)
MSAGNSHPTRIAMRYLVLATDYDGTLASQGRVDDDTLASVKKLKKSGRKAVMVTGRELDDLKNVFPQIGEFELVVAENGGLLYSPSEEDVCALAEAPNEEFIARLKKRGVPFSVGHTIVATSEPHQTEVLEAIKELGLELQVIFNKGSVMVLPSGVNKKTGLEAALARMHLSPHNVAGIGDAENDHVFLTACECGVAVANALPALKERADVVMKGDHGRGVSELIRQILEDDLRSWDHQLKRRRIFLGKGDDGEQVCIAPYRGTLLFAGPSGSGKSSAATGLVERLAEQGYQFCLIDPEGDYENFMGAVQFGSPQAGPEISQVLKALDNPRENIVVNLLGVPMEDRPAFFASLLPQVLEVRAHTARPHWLVVDEAHHMLPSSWVPAGSTVPQNMTGMILITVHPDTVSPAVLKNVEVAIAFGKKTDETLGALAKAVSETAPPVAKADMTSGSAMVWLRGERQKPFEVKLEPGKSEHKRHVRKYAEGDLGPDVSFYFRGPKNKLNLRAKNLDIFSTIADGVDDETWLFHLRQGDYSRWFREAIKDAELADEAERIEKDKGLDASESRSRIKGFIAERYTAAA